MLNIISYQKFAIDFVSGKFRQQNLSELCAITQTVLMTLLRTAELEKQNHVEVVLAAAKSAILMRKPDVRQFILAA